MEGLFHILERKYAQNNAHLWEQKLLVLLLVIKKYFQITWTYQKVSLLYSKKPVWNKTFRQNLHKLGGSKHASNFLRSIKP